MHCVALICPRLAILLLAVLAGPGRGAGDRRVLGKVQPDRLPISAASTTFDNLKQNTHYALTLHTRSNNSDCHTAARLCFRTAPDLDRAIGKHGTDNYASISRAGGCLAFSGTEAQITAGAGAPGWDAPRTDR